MSSSPPRTAVIIPVLNGAATLGRQLAALTQQEGTQPFEVVIADNGSTDATRDIAAEWQTRLPQLRVVDAGSRRGITFARNVGAASTKADALLFCDCDDVASSSWVREMQAALSESDMVGGALDLTLLNGPDALSWAPHFDVRSRLPIASGFLPHAIGANFAIRSDAYTQVGGCDETFIACGDDIDLSWRVQLAGRTLAFAPDAVMHYRLRDSARAMARQHFAYGVSEALLYKKFRSEGLTRMSLRTSISLWLRVGLSAAPSVTDHRIRLRQFGQAGYLAGRVAGMFRHRVLFW